MSIQTPPIDTWILSTDQIALPDFNAGAMENWGLVTYRESSLVFDPLSSSISNKERVVTVIAHELAHQVGSYGSTKKEQSLRVSGPHLACASRQLARGWIRLVMARLVRLDGSSVSPAVVRQPGDCGLVE